MVTQVQLRRGLLGAAALAALSSVSSVLGCIDAAGKVTDEVHAPFVALGELRGQVVEQSPDMTVGWRVFLQPTVAV